LSRECSRDGAAGREVRQFHNIAAAPFKPYCAAFSQFVPSMPRPPSAGSGSA
jgi:hypothetical protein